MHTYRSSVLVNANFAFPGEYTHYPRDHLLTDSRQTWPTIHSYIHYTLRPTSIHRSTSAATGLTFRSTSLPSENDSWPTLRGYDTEARDDGSQRVCFMLGRGKFQHCAARMWPTRPLRPSSPNSCRAFHRRRESLPDFLRQRLPLAA